MKNALRDSFLKLKISEDKRKKMRETRGKKKTEKIVFSGNDFLEQFFRKIYILKIWDG